MAPKALLLILVPCLVFFAAHLLVESKADNDTLNQFLENYGYYDAKGPSQEAALKLFQRNYGLEQTGEPDAETIAKMRAPRCGNPDMITTTTLDFPIWTSKNLLTYAFVLPEKPAIPLDQLQQTFGTAFSKWAQHSPRFEFHEVPLGLAEADILIGFFNGSQPLDDGTDLARRALAFTIMEPPPSLHLNAAVKWSTGQPSGEEMDLESVAMHEIGDMLGLGHRMDPESVMYAELSPGVTKRDLVQQDIDAIRALYPN